MSRIVLFPCLLAFVGLFGGCHLCQNCYDNSGPVYECGSLPCYERFGSVLGDMPYDNAVETVVEKRSGKAEDVEEDSAPGEDAEYYPPRKPNLKEPRDSDARDEAAWNNRPRQSHRRPVSIKRRPQ